MLIYAGIDSNYVQIFLNTYTKYSSNIKYLFNYFSNVEE